MNWEKQHFKIQILNLWMNWEKLCPNLGFNVKIRLRIHRKKDGEQETGLVD